MLFFTIGSSLLWGLPSRSYTRMLRNSTLRCYYLQHFVFTVTKEEKEGGKEERKRLILFLKPTSHLCVFHLNSIYSEKPSLLSYPRYWSYPLCPHFPYLLHLENDPQKQQAMYEERTQQNMVTWRARAESALRKTTISYVKRCWKDWVKHPSHALSSVARAKRPFHRFFVWLRF